MEPCGDRIGRSVGQVSRMSEVDIIIYTAVIVGIVAVIIERFI